MIRGPAAAAAAAAAACPFAFGCLARACANGAGAAGAGAAARAACAGGANAICGCTLASLRPALENSLNGPSQRQFEAGRGGAGTVREGDSDAHSLFHCSARQRGARLRWLAPSPLVSPFDCGCHIICMFSQSECALCLIESHGHHLLDLGGSGGHGGGGDGAGGEGEGQGETKGRRLKRGGRGRWQAIRTGAAGAHDVRTSQ